jgi:predicted Zn-dependent protease
MTIRRIALLPLLLLLLPFLLPAVATAQIRGEGRITGKVVDEKKQPLADVSVRATKTGETQVLEAKSNSKGEWTLNQLAYGEWTLQITKDGFQPQQGKVTVSEEANLQKVDVTMARPAADPNAEIQAELKRAEGMMRATQYAEARKVYEDLLAKYPAVVQLHRFVAATHAGEKNYPKAVESLRLLLEKEPGNAETKMLLADLLIEGGSKDEGLAMLRSIDLAQVKDPYPFINGAISLIRDNKPEEAISLLNTILEKFPSLADTYYYRGRAYIAAKKLPEAKADLEKFVATAPPDARELADAKKILEQLKDVK